MLSSGTSIFSRSSGTTRCTAPGLPVVATRNARRMISGIFSADLIWIDDLVTGSNSLTQSNSVMTPRPSPGSGTSMVSRMTGTEEPWDSATGGREYIAPAPDGASNTPTLFDTRA